MALERDPLGRKAVAYWSATLITDSTDLNGWLAAAGKGVDVYDESDNLEPEYADITTRKKASGGFTARKPVIRDGEVTFDFSWETNNATDAFVQTLIDTSNAGSELAMAFFDYAHDDPDIVTGEVAQGIIGNFYLSFSKTAAIRDAQRGSCTATAASFVQWHKYVES